MERTKTVIAAEQRLESLPVAGRARRPRARRPTQTKSLTERYLLSKATSMNQKGVQYEI